jgi:hypothetical protein
MATIEERLAAIEHDHEELKQKIELQTIAIGALVNKATLEKLNEKYDKLFQALQNHDQFISMQLSELREKVEVQVEGKIVGMQTEMRQSFSAVNARFEQQDGKIAGVQAEMRQGFNAVNARFEQQDGKIAGVQAEMRQGFDVVNARFGAMDARFDQIMVLLAALAPKPDQGA